MIKIMKTSRITTIILFSVIINGYSRQSPPIFNENIVFQPGENSYKCFRIPSIIKAPNGDLIAFAEGRVDHCGDADNIDIVCKYSTDDGITWSSLIVVVDNSDMTCGNMAPVVDYLDPEYPKGRIIMTYNTSVTDEQAILSGRGVREVWMIASIDNGRTWSVPKNITLQVHKPYQPKENPLYNFKEDWRWYAITPGHAFQVIKGKYRGRLFFAANHSLPDKSYFSHCFYSDDHGKTWQLGGNLVKGTNEATACELSDGNIMINARNYNSRKRFVGISNNGGISWQKSFEDDNLPDPICEGSILNDYANKAILFSNAANVTERKQMTVRMSFDDGKTWKYNREIRPTFSAYSDLVILKKNLYGLLYEANEYGYLYFASFNKSWLGNISGKYN